MLVYFERDGYKDAADGSISILDAFYYATVSLSTTGYGDITPVSDEARLTNILVITPLRFIFLIVLVSTTVEVLTQADPGAIARQPLEEAHEGPDRDRRLRGQGAGGPALADRPRPGSAHGGGHRLGPVRGGRGDPPGVTGVVGDARSEQVLRDAGIPEASRVIVAADQDDTAIMVTLRVRAMAPTATIVAAAREASAGDLLRQSGADRVITHAESAGNLMGLSLLSANVGEMLEDLMDTGRGLEVVERPISRAELGLSPADIQSGGDLVLAVVRGSEVIRFDQGAVRVFQPGDRVVVIRKAPDQVHPTPGPVPGKVTPAPC